jgi:Mn-dependent DtxR family transcriptional regulator
MSRRAKTPSPAAAKLVTEKPEVLAAFLKMMAERGYFIYRGKHYHLTEKGKQLRELIEMTLAAERARS